MVRLLYKKNEMIDESQMQGGRRGESRSTALEPNGAE